MATRLGKPTPRAAAALRALADMPASEKVRVGPPWAGYVPDINPQLLDQRAFVQVRGLLPAGEKLTAPPGWQAFEEATRPLPLGGVSHTWGSDPGQPIMAMGRLALLAGQAEENLAVTCDDGTTDGTLFRYGTAGKWEEVAADSTAVVTDSTNVMQSCVYPLVATGTGKRGIFIWTTGVGSNCHIWYYPDAAGKYALWPTPSGNPYDYDPFQARSVCSNMERVYFGGTSENNVACPSRVRWTIPSWTTMSADNMGAIDKVGMGAIDFTEFKGQLVKVLPLSNDGGVACYFEDGVGILENTWQVAAPHRKRVATRLRGLLGDNAIVDLGGGLHFGLFTDGWFFFDGTNWKEAGTLQQGDMTLHKWITTFFSLLRMSSANRIALGYDQRLRHIHISFPTGRGDDPDTYWIYDLRGDRVWPQSNTAYINGNWAISAPNCFEEYRQITSGGYTWATLPGSWASLGSNPWGSFDADLGQLRLCHGTVGGRVWQHEPAIYTRGGQPPQWTMRTRADYGNPYEQKCLLRRAIEYIGGEPGAQLTYSVGDDRASGALVSGTVDLLTTGGGRQVARMEVHQDAAVFDVDMAGVHPTTLLGWEDEVVGTVGEAENLGS